MKKVFNLLSLMMLMIANIAFAQTGGCTPTFPMLPKPIKDKIEINYDIFINKFAQDNTRQMAVAQYLQEFDAALTSGQTPTADDYKKLDELKRLSANNETVMWINKTAGESATYEIFMERIGSRIAAAKTVEELSVLVLSSYQLQIINHTYKNQTNTVAKCSGWWSCWGKCAAGIAGGAITGALGGAAIAGVPTVGIGAVPGAIIGGIGGGLTGAAAAC